MPVLRWETPPTTRCATRAAHKKRPTPLEREDAHAVALSSIEELTAHPGEWAVLVDDRDPGFCQRLASAIRTFEHLPPDSYQWCAVTIDGRSRLYARCTSAP